MHPVVFDNYKVRYNQEDYKNYDGFNTNRKNKKLHMVGHLHDLPVQENMNYLLERRKILEDNPEMLKGYGRNTKKK